MRAVTSATHSASPTDNFVRVLDQFAALSSYSSDATAVGGYRVLSSQRASQHQTYRTSLPAPSVAARAGARVRWTGSLSVLFIGGLGLAVLAGPANCPCTEPLRRSPNTILSFAASRLRGERAHDHRT